MIGLVTRDGGHPPHAGGVAWVNPLGREVLEQALCGVGLSSQVVRDGETEPVGGGARLGGGPALKPTHGPHPRSWRLRPVIVRRQLECREQADVGGRPTRLWRQTRRFGQPLVDVGGPPEGGERPDLGREHGELTGVTPPPFERVLQLRAVIARQMVGEGQVEPVDGPATEQPAVGPELGKGGRHLARAIERERALGHQP